MYSLHSVAPAMYMPLMQEGALESSKAIRKSIKKKTLYSGRKIIQEVPPSIQEVRGVREAFTLQYVARFLVSRCLQTAS